MCLTSFEAHLTSSPHDKILLLLERALMEDLSMITIERFLRYTQCQRILLLVTPHRKAKLIEGWEKAKSWEDGSKLSEHFSGSFTPQNDQQDQITIATVFDIQTQVGNEKAHPFFKAFDVII